jgi:hypothetical protein
MAVKNAISKITRRFYYYQFDLDYSDQHNSRVATYEKDQLATVLAEFFKASKSLVYDNTLFDKKYMLYEKPDGNFVYTILDSLDETHIKFRILLCRSKLLPYIEQNGVLSPMTNYISAGDKLAEVTHGIFFLKHNALALEYNFAGAKIKDISDYLVNKSSIEKIFDANFYNMVNIDTLKKLKTDKEMSLFAIKIDSNSEAIKELIEEDDAFRALDYMKNEIDSVELVLRRRISKSKKGFKLDSLTPEFVKRLFLKNKSDFHKFKVKYGYGTEEIDLLSENFMFSEDFIPIGNSKTFESSEAYDAMIQYFIKNVQKYT